MWASMAAQMLFEHQKAQLDIQSRNVSSQFFQAYSVNPLNDSIKAGIEAQVLNADDQLIRDEFAKDGIDWFDP